jgi:peptidoglycan hydrolase-like protein with peptidoglycan-binding domain
MWGNWFGPISMRLAFRLALFVLFSWASAGLALAAFDDSRLWFEQLTPEERSATQTDLILLGHYEYLVDGKFGRGTFDALEAFQRSEGAAPTGVLSERDRVRLRDLAREVDTRFGLELVSDNEARVAMMIPGRLLSIRSPTGTGTSYVSEDGEFSLETMHSALTENSFEDLFETMTAPDPERIVTYRSYGSGRFVVSGQIGDYSFYTMFVSAGEEAVGYSLAWGKTYEREGPIASVYLASNFNPLSNLPPPPELEKAAAEPPSQFDLPSDQPDLIVLNAEIDEATPLAFRRALEARPAVRVLALNSPGGSVDAAVGMALEIRKRGLATYVPAEMGCYSACAYMFFAGTDRHAKGELGVHQISSDVADLVMAQTTLGDVIDALQSFGVHPQVISHMLRTPPADMYVFDAEELAEWGIEAGDPIEVTVALTDPVSMEGSPDAFVQLSSHSSSLEAGRSRDYLAGRWGTLFGGAELEIDRAEQVYYVRLPMPSVERANTVCSAIKADGGGCYVTAQ